jgi:hypothetical protein
MDEDLFFAPCVPVRTPSCSALPLATTSDALEHGYSSGIIISNGPDGLPAADPRHFKDRSHPKDRYVATTPSTLSRQIEQFAHELTGAVDLHFVPVRPFSFAKERGCYGNCELGCHVLGGEMVLGYLIWNTHDRFLTAEHHCVLQLPDGRLVDPTPQITGTRTVLFGRSDQPATKDFIEDFLITGMTGDFKLLVDHPYVHEAVRVLDQASNRLQQCENEAIRAGRSMSILEHRRWANAVEETERLLDAYYRQRQQKVEHRERQLRRKRRKAKRQAKKRNRAGTS